MRITLAIAALLALGTGCSGASPGVDGGAAGACAMLVRFQGVTYRGAGAGVLPVAGEPVGTGVVPPCSDHSSASPAGVGHVRLARIPGVPPSVALVSPAYADAILVRDGSHPGHSLDRYLHAPACRPVDAPVALRGPWGGILDAGGRTELDMRPPYDVDLFVRAASAPRYLRALLTVRVPATLGRPLSRTDIRRSLWKGGSISVTAACSRGRYVATAVSAHPAGD